jgi:hypothetical protein
VGQITIIVAFLSHTPSTSIPPKKLKLLAILKLLLLLFYLTANGVLPGGSGTTIKRNTARV